MINRVLWKIIELLYSSKLFRFSFLVTSILCIVINSNYAKSIMLFHHWLDKTITKKYKFCLWKKSRIAYKFKQLLFNDYLSYFFNIPPRATIHCFICRAIEFTRFWHFFAVIPNKISSIIVCSCRTRIGFNVFNYLSVWSHMLSIGLRFKCRIVNNWKLCKIKFKQLCTYNHQVYSVETLTKLLRSLST